MEELNRDTVTSKGKYPKLTVSENYITYLESYGPLALLIFMRTKPIDVLHPKTARGGLTTYESRDYMQFLAGLLEHYKQQFVLAENSDREAIDKLTVLMDALPSIDDLKIVVNMKRTTDDFFDQFMVYEENVVLITMVLLWESYIKFRHIGPHGKGSQLHKLQMLAIKVFRKVQSNDLQLLHTLLELAYPHE